VTTAFGNGNANAESVALQNDGKIVAAGASHMAYASDYPFVLVRSDFVLVRYNADGSLHSSFNGTGNVTTTIGRVAAAHSVVVQRDGKIVLAGYSTNKRAEAPTLRWCATKPMATSIRAVNRTRESMTAVVRTETHSMAATRYAGIGKLSPELGPF